MRVAQRKFLLLTACLFLLTSLGTAEVITFNSLPGNGTAIPNGFAGMDWNNFYDVSMAELLTGNVPGTASSNNTTFATNNGLTPAWFTSTGTFSFDSAMLSTDGVDPMRLEVLGLLNGNVVDRAMLTLSSPVPVQVTFNWSGFDGVRFVPQPVANSSEKVQFALSQLVINVASVPEPTSLLLMGSGLGMLCIQARKLLGRK
jgi:hypothetical protein